MKNVVGIIGLCVALSGIPAFAQQTQDQSGQPTGAAKSAEPAASTEGEVRKVDKEAKKLTIRHGPIQNLEMPAMTMVFQVSDASLLDEFKTGDKIRFTAEKQGGAFTVTRVEPAQ